MKNLIESLFDDDIVMQGVPISTRDAVKAVCNRLSKDFNTKPVDNGPTKKDDDVSIIYKVYKSGKSGTVQFVTKCADRIQRSSIGSMGIGLCLEFYISSYNSDTTDLCRVDVGWASYYDSGELSSIQNFMLWDALPPASHNLKSLSFDTANIDTLLNYISKLCHILRNISKRDKNKICRSLDDYMNKSKCMDDIKVELSDM